MGQAVKFMGMAALAMSVLSGAHAATTYTLTDLGAFIPNAQYSIGYSINEAGWVAGVVDAPGTTLGNRAFVYDPTSGVTVLRDAPSVSSVKINDTGLVVGNSGTRSFIYDHGTVKTVIGFSGPVDVINAINNEGALVGTSTDSARHVHGVQWDTNGYMTTLYQPIPGYPDLSINAINNQGVVAGVAFTAYSGGAQQAFIQSGNTVTNLPALSGSFAYVTDINERNEVVGNSADAEGNNRAVLWRDGAVIALGSPQLPFTMSAASAINNLGQVVGYVGGVVDHSSIQSAALFQGDDVVILESLVAPDVAAAWDLYYAVDINDAGQIVGSGIFNGQVRAFLLTPVPEPGTFVLMGLGLIGVLTARRRAMAA